MKKGWDKIKSLGKLIDSAIDPIYIIIVAYMTIIGLFIAFEVLTTKST